MLVVALIAFGVTGVYFTGPRAKEASAKFRAAVTRGMPRSEVVARARALGAGRILHLEEDDARGRKHKVLRVMWFYFPVSLVPVGYGCLIPLVNDQAETIGCGWHGPALP